MMNDQANNTRHFIILSLTFLIMLAWTWGTWPDPIVDFGRELYVPWQITQGKILYRDIAYFNGPFSPYFNAMIFEILGVSLRSLVMVNLVLLAAMTWMIWRILARIADEFAATVACVVLLTVFAFIQLGGVGNYNFVTPYSHEITHGIVLSFAAISCIAANLKKPRTTWIASAGFLLGLIFLTKPEVFLAAAAATLCGVMFGPRRWKSLAIFLAMMCVAPAVAFVLLNRAMPAVDAMRGAAGAWVYLFDPQIAEMKFYRRILGTLDVAQSARMILYATVCYAAITVAAMSAGKTKLHAALLFTASAILAALAFYFCDLNMWQQALRGLSLVMPALAIATVVAAIRFREPQRIIRAVVVIFATTLLAKMFLSVLPFHYGFALAMPATAITVVAMLSWLPRSSNASRAVLLPVVGLFVFAYLYVFARMYVEKTALVGSGGDVFWADPSAQTNDLRGRAVNMMLSSLAKLPPGATLATVPEGAMVNYLSRRPSPTPYINLMPPEVIMFGQEQIVRSFASHPPDYIVLVPSDSTEYGYRGFALDYGRDIFQWIVANYGPIPSPRVPQFPLLLLKHKTAATTQGVE